MDGTSLNGVGRCGLRLWPQARADPSKLSRSCIRFQCSGIRDLGVLRLAVDFILIRCFGFLRHVRLIKYDALLAVFPKLAASDASSNHASTPSSSSAAAAALSSASSSSMPAKVCRPRLCPFGMKSRLYKRRPHDRREVVFHYACSSHA